MRRNLEKNPLNRGQAIAYFYCDRNKNDHQNNREIFRSLVRQLSTPGDGDLIPSCIDGYFAVQEKQGFPSSSLTFQESAVLIRNLLEGYTKVTIILDALDECEKSTRHILINEIDRLVNEPSPCVLKVLISSRPENDIKDRFEGGPNVSIKATDNQEDIKTFLVDMVRTSPGNWKKMVTSCSGLEDEILNTLYKKSDGMYAFTSSASCLHKIVSSYAELEIGRTHV